MDDQGLVVANEVSQPVSNRLYLGLEHLFDDSHFLRPQLAVPLEGLYLWGGVIQLRYAEAVFTPGVGAAFDHGPTLLGKDSTVSCICSETPSVRREKK